jgi:aldose 1-epimerase
MRTIVLSSDLLRAEVLPDVGGAMARLGWIGDRIAEPVLRPFTGAGVPRPNQLACFPLLPWSNRLAGGFTHDGRVFSIAPNRDGEPYPIHGEGWQRPWRIAQQSAMRLALLLDRRDGAPFSYVATMTYALSGAMLAVTLELTNTGAFGMPFGLGLHPWMPRSEGVTVRASACQVWRSGADRLPAQAMPVPPPWDFDQPRVLPPTPIDNVFGGWDGRAEIAWPHSGIDLCIEADASYYIVYAPEGADFFCFEPVDHVINAHNMAGGAVRNGLSILEPGQQMRRQFNFSVAHRVA